MLKKKNIIELGALHWYFGFLLSKSSTAEDNIKHSIVLGSLIHGLNHYAELSHVCALDNGETGLTKDKEYEYVGRGFVDPFYRLTHTNDDCFTYAYDILNEQDKSDLTGIQRIRNLGFDIQGMKALVILVMLVLTQKLNELSLQPTMGSNLAKMPKFLGQKRFIAELTRNQRVNFLNFPKKDLNYMYNSLGNALREANQTLDISMMILGGFIAAAGIVAVALAFAVLNAAPMGAAGIAVAVIGGVAIAGGVGFFAKGVYNYSQTPADESLDFSLAS